nr:hypothetical protein [Tanacetum cinerariifolium]
MTAASPAAAPKIDDYRIISEKSLPGSFLRSRLH